MAGAAGVFRWIHPGLQISRDGIRQRAQTLRKAQKECAGEQHGQQEGDRAPMDAAGSVRWSGSMSPCSG